MTTTTLLHHACAANGIYFLSIPLYVCSYSCVVAACACKIATENYTCIPCNNLCSVQ